MKSADVADNIGNKNKADSTLESGSDSMNNSLIDILIAKFQVINTQVVTFDNVLSALSNIMTTAQTSADTAKGISPDISGTFEGERAILNELNKTIGQSSLIDSSLFSTISHDIDAVSGYMNSISSIYNDMGYNIDDFNKSISQMGESINNTLVMVRNIEDNLNETTNKLVEFKTVEYTRYYRPPYLLTQMSLHRLYQHQLQLQQKIYIQSRIMAQQCLHSIQYFLYGLGLLY